MTDDYFDQLDALSGGGDWSGTSGATPFTGGGQALERFYAGLQDRVRPPLIDYGALTAAKGGPAPYNPFSTGRVGQASPAFQPAAPPERYNVNLLGESISTVAESALGQGFLGTPGAQRGGVMPINTGFGSFGLATVPVNFQNFATYAREAPLALITGALGHKYQQPVGQDPYAQPEGPQNTDDLLANISQGDWENALDNIIDGVAAFGNGIADVAMWPVDRFREANAISRGQGMRDIIRTGSTPGTWIAWATSLLDSSRFNWQGIVTMAERRGLDPLDMAAELWDLNPEVVRQIAANPDISDDQLEKLVKLEPFSYDPGVNVAVELAANIAPLVFGAGLVRGVGLGGRVLGGVLRPIEAAAGTQAAGRVGASVLTTWENLTAAGLIGKPIAVAGRIGSWSLPVAWRGARVAEAANRYSLIAGTSIRFGEWGLKQAFEIGGYDEGVKLMDQWLWEMPLSQNPGLMLLDAFAVHPLRTAKALYAGSKDVVTLKLMGGEDLAVSPVAARSLGAIGDMPLATVQEQLLDKLGWDAAAVERLFGEDGPHGKTDLLNGLLYVAAQVVRDRHETRLRFLEPTADVVTRNEAFWRTYGDEAVETLQQALTGRGKGADAIRQAIMVEFWERKNLIDASELGNEGMIGPYDGHVALLSFTSWVRASAKVREYGQTGEVLKLREDVNRQVVAAYRERLAAMKPGDLVPARMLNELRVGIPALVKYERGALRRRGNATPKITARVLTRILDAAEAEQGITELREARPRTTGVPALPPELADKPIEIARAFGLRQATVDKLLASTPEDLAGPVPDDLARVLLDVYRMQEAEVRRRPEVAWQRVNEWWQRMYPGAVERGQAIADVQRFGKILADRYAGAGEGGLDAEALRRISESITHPYRMEETRGPVGAATAEVRNEALSTWLDEVARWLDAPERGLRVVTALDGRNYIELDGFKVADVPVINRLAEIAARVESLTPEDQAILADPLAHPLERAAAVKRAMLAEPGAFTEADQTRIGDVADLESVYGSAVKDVLGEDATVTRETVEQLTLKGIAAAEDIDTLREQARSLGQVIDRSPTRHLTDELTDFYERAQVLGGIRLRPRGKTPASAANIPEVPNWRSVPITPQGVRKAQAEQSVANARTAAQARLERATTALADADASVRRVSTMGDTGIRLEDVTWADEPVASFPTKKAALHAASELHSVEGTITGVSKVGSRWKVFEGEYTPSERPVAAPEAPPAPEAPEVAPAPAPESPVRPAGPAYDGPAAPGVGDAVVIDGTKYRIRTLPGDQPGDSAIGAIYLAKAGPSWKRSAIDGAVQQGDRLTWDKTAGVWRVERAAMPDIIADEPAVPPWRQAQLDRDAAAEAARVEMRERLATEPPRSPAELSSTALTEAQDYTFGRMTADAETREAANREVVAAAQQALLDSGARPTWVVDWSRTRMGHVIKVRWEGDVPFPDEPVRDTTTSLTGTAPLGMVKEGEPLTTFTALTQEAIDLERAYRAESHKNTSGWYWNKAAQKRIKEAEASLAGQDPRLTVPPATPPVVPPVPAAPAGPPPIVQQLGEAQRVREAQVEAMQREEVAQQAAFDEAQGVYEGGRILPRGIAGADPYATPEMDTRRAILEADLADAPERRERFAEIARLVDTAVNTGAVERATKEAISSVELEGHGQKWTATGAIAGSRFSPDQPNVLQERIVGTGKTKRAAYISLAQSALRRQDELIRRWKKELDEATPGQYRLAEPEVPREPVTFLDPADNKTEFPARVVLVDADALLTSDRPGFPPNVQPRSRASRASSEEQIVEYAKDLQPGKLFGVTEGSTGMPVVLPEGVVLAGNGRTMAIRLASPAQYAKYRAALEAEAVKYGYSADDVAALNRPMLVRELGTTPPDVAERLAWQLNEMPIGDLAPVLARELQPSDIRAFKVGDEQSLGDAIRSNANTPAVAKMIGRLPRDWHARYFDPKTGLNEPGAKLLEATLLSKVLRAEDRARPGFEAARAVVFQIAEQGGEDIRRISGGIAEGAAQLVKVYELAETGALGPDILNFGDDLAPALARIIELRDTGLNMEGVGRALDNVTAFDEFTLTPTQTTLAKLLAASTTQREIRTFTRAVARAAEEGPVQGQEALFADIPQVDYTGLLNEGVKAWNAIRPEGGQMDYFASTEAPYDIPLGTGVSENVLGGTEGPARMTQPLAAEEVDAEIAARTLGEDVTTVTGEPLHELIDSGASADFAAFEAEVYDIFDTMVALGQSVEPTGPTGDWTAFTKAQLDAFDGLLESANRGDITPAEAFVLQMMGAGVRRAATGELNMRLTLIHDSGIRYGLQGLRVRFAPTAHDLARQAELEARVAAADAAKPKARVVRPQPQKPITREELAADVGPDVPFDPSVAAVDDALASTEHTVIVGDNPTVNRAIRRAVDAPRVEDTTRRLIEIHAPDARVVAERAEARRQAALADVEAAQRELADVDQRAIIEEGPDAPTAPSVFPDDETRGLWERLMVGSDLDQLAAAMGASEPRVLGQLADAVESIDRGVFVDPVTGVGLTADEAMALRTHLMRVMNGELEAAIERSGKARATRFTRNVTRPPDDFNAEALQDRTKLVMDQLDEVVVVDPTLPPIEGFLGTQYVLASPPKRSKVDGGGLSPRLLFPSLDAVDAVVPGLKAELQVGRMEDWPRRVGNHRSVRLIDHIFGPRSEKEIRARAVTNFKREVGRFVDPDTTDGAELKKIDKVIEGAFNNWRTRQEDIKLGPYQQYRRISLMGPEVLNRLFDEAVLKEYADRPAWLSDLYASGQSPAKLWRRADNRLRNYIRESGLPLSSSLEKVYGKAADLGERPGRAVTVIYHVARFLMDVRWVGLEAIEPMMIAMPRGGVGPVLEASVLRKSSKVQRVGRAAGLVRQGEPLAFGVPARQLAMREFAHWAASGDTEQPTGVRWRYLTRELAREQERPFRETLKTMMREEPALRRIVDESDNGNVDAFLSRLDRDWQLAEQGTKEFGSTAESAAFFKRWLDDGIIDEQTYSEFVEAKKYTSHPAIEAELAKTMGDPVTEAVLNRLAAINQSLFHDLTAAFFGQENRSNLQRAVNHPFLFWPISYQIKATKWLLKLMLDEFGGVDTGATVAGAFQSVYDEHRRRWVADPAYRQRFTENRTLYFLAGMIFPIIPTELGVSLSPFTRLMLNPEYDRPFGAMGVGPIYTNLALLPRLITEQTKGGGLAEGLPQEAKDKLRQFFPQTITVNSPSDQKRPTSTIEAANRETIVPGSIPIPFEEPVDRANP